MIFSGNVLGNIVVSELKEMSLNLKNCIGIGTDGCSVMTSVLRGAVREVQKSCPNSIYSPCTNHALNLSISKSSKVQIVRNTVGILQETISFFHLSFFFILNFKFFLNFSFLVNLINF